MPRNNLLATPWCARQGTSFPPTPLSPHSTYFIKCCKWDRISRLTLYTAFKNGPRLVGEWTTSERQVSWRERRSVKPRIWKPKLRNVSGTWIKHPFSYLIGPELCLTWFRQMSKLSTNVQLDWNYLWTSIGQPAIFQNFFHTIKMRKLVIRNQYCHLGFMASH